MEREFKVGDKVKIRQWDDMEEEFGLDETGDINCNYCFVDYESIKELCGETAVITRIEEDGKVDLKFDNESELDTDWMFSTDMIELLEEK